MPLGLQNAYGLENAQQGLRQRIIDQLNLKKEQQDMQLREREQVLREQEAQQRAEQFKMTQADRASALTERTNAANVTNASKLAPELPMDQNVAPGAASILDKGGLGGQLYAPPTQGETETGKPFVSAEQNPRMNLGTPGQQQAATRKQFIGRLISGMPENSPERKSLEYFEATDKNPPAGVFDKPTTQPVMRVNPRTGKMEQIGDAPVGAHFVSEPTPGTPDEAVSLSPQGLDAAARVYAQTGQLPPMGMGKAGAGVRAQIINRAAALNPDLNIVGNKAGTAADTGSLAQLQKNYDAVEAFSKTATENRKQFDAIASKIPDTGVPLLNQPWRAIQRATGNTDLSQFDVLRQSLQNEYARLVSQPSLSGQLSDSARHEIEAGLNPNATVQQLKAALDTFAKESDNRKGSFASQIAEVKGRLGGGGVTPSQSAGAGETPEARRARLRKAAGL